MAASRRRSTPVLVSRRHRRNKIEPCGRALALREAFPEVRQILLAKGTGSVCRGAARRVPCTNGACPVLPTEVPLHRAGWPVYLKVLPHAGSMVLVESLSNGPTM